MWYCPHGAPNQWHYGKPNEWDNVGLPCHVEHLKKREEREAKEKKNKATSLTKPYYKPKRNYSKIIYNYYLVVQMYFTYRHYTTQI